MSRAFSRFPSFEILTRSSAIVRSRAAGCSAISWSIRDMLQRHTLTRIPEKFSSQGAEGPSWSKVFFAPLRVCEVIFVDIYVPQQPIGLIGRLSRSNDRGY